MDHNLRARETLANFLVCVVLACFAALIYFGYAGWWAKTVSLPAAKAWMLACLVVGMGAFFLLHLAMSAVARAKVAGGAALLDRHQQDEWLANINRETLKLRSNTRCVLAQLYGDPFDGLTDLGIDRDGAFDRGFGVGPAFWKGWWLTPAWRRLIEQRLTAMPATS